MPAATLEGTSYKRPPEEWRFTWAQLFPSLLCMDLNCCMFPTHSAYQMEAEYQVLKLSPRLIVSPFQFHPHTIPQAHEKTTASLQRPGFSSLCTYQSTIQPGKHELTSTKRA